jgi:hypothetical protein
MAVFTFQPKWKEELVCTGPAGSFVLDLTMGTATAYLPTERAWVDKAPWWAKRLWPVLHDELQTWCRANDVGFVIDAGAAVY